MASEIVMPKLGEVMEKGVVARWLKEEGSRVKKGEALFEAETEKINYEIEAPEAGTLRHAVREGAEVPVGGVVGYIL